MPENTSAATRHRGGWRQIPFSGENAAPNSRKLPPRQIADLHAIGRARAVAFRDRIRPAAPALPKFVGRR
jgi:hypothetical protein